MLRLVNDGHLLTTSCVNLAEAEAGLRHAHQSPRSGTLGHLPFPSEFLRGVSENRHPTRDREEEDERNCFENAVEPITVMPRGGRQNPEGKADRRGNDESAKYPVLPSYGRPRSVEIEAALDTKARECFDARMALGARCDNSNVAFDGGYVIIEPTGVKGKLAKMLRSGVAAWKEPESIVEELEGPKKAALCEALGRDREVLAAILTAIRRERAADLPDGAEDSPKEGLGALIQAVRDNRRAVAAAIGRHKADIARALREDKETAAVLLNTYIPLDDLESIEAAEGVLRIASSEKKHRLPFPESEAASVLILVAAVRDAIGTTTPGLASGSLASDLRQLKQLRDDGLIAEADYEAKKRQMLGLD